MKISKILLLILLVTVIAGCEKVNTKLPHDFVFLSDIDTTIIESVRYHTNENFLGRRVKGYKVNKVVSTQSSCFTVKKST